MREEWEILALNDEPSAPEEALRISVYPGRTITFTVQAVEDGVATVAVRVEHDPDRSIIARLRVLQ